MGVIAWDDMAKQDLRDATDESAVRREFLDLAESELRYPPNQGTDEGFAVQYDMGFAYRRALRRETPSTATDLTADLAAVDDGGFPYGDYFYVYRPLNEGEARAMGQRGQAARLIVKRLLHNSAMDGQLSRH